MEINWFFWGFTAFFALFEYILSHAIGEHPLVGRKSILTDIMAAGFMWFMSFVVYFTAAATKLKCNNWSQLPGFDTNSCLEYSDKVFTVGDVLATTIGLNPMIAATVFFIIFSIIGHVYSKYRT